MSDDPYPLLDNITRHQLDRVLEAAQYLRDEILVNEPVDAALIAAAILILSNPPVKKPRTVRRRAANNDVQRRRV